MLTLLTIPQIRIEVDSGCYLRDPQATDVGRKLLQQALLLIDKSGIEEFTFAKLAKAIDSTEATIYRYFENKHCLLNYLLSWYWASLNFRIAFEINSLTNVSEKLEKFLRILVDADLNFASTPFLDMQVLHHLALTEADKVFFTHRVDEENQDRFFRHYKMLCTELASLIQQYNTSCLWPKSIAGMLVEQSHRQLFFADHLPSLSDVSKGKKRREETYNYLLFLLHSTTDKSKIKRQR
ncbi:MAG: TetR/AcrR family transcriptional regulator [Bacteroidia bacterium]